MAHALGALPVPPYGVTPPVLPPISGQSSNGATCWSPFSVRLAATCSDSQALVVAAPPGWGLDLPCPPPPPPLPLLLVSFLYVVSSPHLHLRLRLSGFFSNLKSTSIPFSPPSPLTRCHVCLLFQLLLRLANFRQRIKFP